MAASRAATLPIDICVGIRGRDPLETTFFRLFLVEGQPRGPGAARGRGDPCHGFPEQLARLDRPNSGPVIEILRYFAPRTGPEDQLRDLAVGLSEDPDGTPDATHRFPDFLGPLRRVGGVAGARSRAFFDGGESLDFVALGYLRGEVRGDISRDTEQPPNERRVWGAARHEGHLVREALEGDLLDDLLLVGGTASDHSPGLGQGLYQNLLCFGRAPSENLAEVSDAKFGWQAAVPDLFPMATMGGSSASQVGTPWFRLRLRQIVTMPSGAGRESRATPLGHRNGEQPRFFSEF